MLIAGLIGVNLVLALLAVWALRLLRSPGPSRNRAVDTAAASAGDAELDELVDRAVAAAEVPTIGADSFEAVFAFDSRRVGPPLQPVTSTHSRATRIATTLGSTPDRPSRGTHASTRVASSTNRADHP